MQEDSKRIKALLNKAEEFFQDRYVSLRTHSDFSGCLEGMGEKVYVNSVGIHKDLNGLIDQLDAKLNKLIEEQDGN